MTKPVKFQKYHKFGAKSFRAEDGTYWASEAEHKRWCDLKVLQRAGLIKDLVRQKRYILRVNGQTITSYTADFEYWDNEGNVLVTEDKKGVRTRDYKLKAKLFKALEGRAIYET